MFASTAQGAELDTQFTRLVSEQRGGSLDEFFIEISQIVRPLFIAPATLVAAALLWFRFRALALLLPVSFGSAIAMTYAMKWFLGRERPAGDLSMVNLQDAAFPSAHVAGTASASMALLQILMPVLRRTMRRLLEVVVLALVACVALSRVWIGAHWLTDVIAGLFVGVVGLLIGLLVLRSSWFRRLIRTR
ncbi:MULTISPECIES: phosphatase PAP2 family protein [unclassified Corynebacterium]|uniref:phosphatase PAP2 family protein n=1 Tax=unclassified Corynebacterium TaxID=2624378 RepID=UPI0030A8A492